MSLKGKLVLVTGAARSGKSYFAENMADSLNGQVIYIATCVPQDEEMEKRVASHQARRPDDWLTIEEPFDPAKVVHQKDNPGRVFLIDCLTLLVSNWILELASEKREEIVLERIKFLANISINADATVIIVSNEVGWAVVPDNPLARDYRDIIGRANQIIASYADEVYITIAGIPLELKTLNKQQGRSVD
jgi:adenosylcobinamide kinase/adenosylcobinamide-phosphate guanylyltransferase